jgi:hypothetical protein
VDAAIVRRVGTKNAKPVKKGTFSGSADTFGE